jgi:mRNA interferase MazF
MNLTKGGIMYEQCEVVIIPFPYSDLTGSKKRPALIISNEKLNETQDRICCLITSNIHKNDLKITKTDLEEGSLPFSSAIRPHRLFTINEQIIEKKICKINKKFHDQLIKIINLYLN